ncbi:MAG TPA: pyrroloquinoline quinone biosynthesis protein PqqB [Gammaproteobacteria bacterium]|nr:pyrroloquinoline quinone biosynthesis protein PqqB [Gammaproteobacteria bacterium]
MHIHVLGSGAGGGFPQWNCNHPISRRARNKETNANPRTQSSIAVSADGRDWFLFNASPDLRQQINDNAILHPDPKQGPRHSPIKGVVVTNADVDHITGLLTLRESQPLRLYGTRRVMGILGTNAVFNVLNPEFVKRETITLNQPTELQHPDGRTSGIVVVPFSVPGKIALWLEDATKGANFGSVEEDTIALEVRDTKGQTRFFYIPGCASMPPELSKRLRGAPLVLFDGTLWTDDEMIKGRVGTKTGKRMGHMSVNEPDGTIAAFKDLGVKRKIFIHINTTNPILLEDSAERKACAAAGWEVAYDGMDINL